MIDGFNRQRVEDVNIRFNLDDGFSRSTVALCVPFYIISLLQHLYRSANFKGC